MTITALPALHGPPGCEPVTGPVIGFMLTGDGLKTVYVSGDDATLDVVREIALPASSEPHGLTIGPDGAIWVALEAGAVAQVQRRSAMA